jgi:hypothetical protein
MDLFRRLATETAAALSLPYPADADAYVTELVHRTLQPQA